MVLHQLFPPLIHLTNIVVKKINGIIKVLKFLSHIVE